MIHFISDNLVVSQKTKILEMSNPDKVKGGGLGGKRHIPSASTALVLGLFLGLCQTIFLVFGAKMLLGIMGVKHVSKSHKSLLLNCFEFFLDSNVGKTVM